MKEKANELIIVRPSTLTLEQYDLARANFIQGRQFQVQIDQKKCNILIEKNKTEKVETAE